VENLQLVGLIFVKVTKMSNLRLLADQDFKKILENNSNPVLFISDVQESSVRRISDKSFIVYITRMVELFKENSFLIIITEFGPSLGSTIADILSLILDYDNQERVMKKEPSAYNLIKNILKKQKIDSVIIVGLEACYCCFVNANMFINNGYQVFISLNGVADSRKDFLRKNKCVSDYRELGVNLLD
jgi:nicotinamidase-related amidase